MADQHEIFRLCRHRINDPGSGIRGLKAAHGREGREWIAVSPEGFGGLLGAEFSAVPDDGGLHTAGRRLPRQEVDFDAAARGERPRRIDIWPYGIAVMNKIKLQTFYFETIFSSVAAMAIFSFAPVTSPVSVTVCDMCGTSLAFLSAASVPVTS